MFITEFSIKFIRLEDFEIFPADSADLADCSLRNFIQKFAKSAESAGNKNFVI